MQAQQITGGLAVTAMWEARDGEADVVADILARFAPQARQEPGVKLFPRVGEPGAVPVLRIVRGCRSIHRTPADRALQGADRGRRRAAPEPA